jgi:gp16 family phage-associated protein
MSIRTPQEVREEFARKGISIAAWATAHGFNTNLVFEVLAGRKKGIRGQSHKIAVMLGLKEGEITTPKDLDLRRPAA